MLARARPTAYSLYSKLAFLFLSLHTANDRQGTLAKTRAKERERIYSRDAICWLAEEKKKENERHRPGF